MTRGERVIAFIEAYCKVPEGNLVGQKIKLLPFQKKFIKAIYDNPKITSRAYLSIARKNGKSALIAAIILAHSIGPEAKLNSQIITGARSRDQAAIIFKLAEKMVRLSSELSKIVKLIPSTKTLIGLPMNVEFRAISAEAGTAHGLSPVLAILDEVGQVKGPYDAFIEAIETAQGAHDRPLLIAISTQAPTDADLFSLWLDDAATGADPHTVSHIYSAPEDSDVLDKKAWKAANPALGKFLNERGVKEAAKKASRLPSDENSFRWLRLNQRVTATAPFISKSVWQKCATPVIEEFKDLPVFGGVDLSSVNDLTAKVYVARYDQKWHVKPTFWLPGEGLSEKSKADRVPYDVWHRQGFLRTTPGKTVDYEFVAATLYSDCERYNIHKIAFDRWNWKHLKAWLLAVGFSESQLEGDEAIFEPFGQGYQSMSPALRDLETDLLNEEIAHAGHPVLTMCASNAVVTSDPAGNRKLDKAKATGRIDGMVALAMARAVAATFEGHEFSYTAEHGVIFA